MFLFTFSLTTILSICACESYDEFRFANIYYFKIKNSPPTPFNKLSLATCVSKIWAHVNYNVGEIDIGK
jgi:hypothetical protein